MTAINEPSTDNRAQPSRVRFTLDRIRRFTCPPDKPQAFLRDLIAPGLGIRATAGSKSYIFQSKLKDGRTVRITIGDWHTLDIDQAREAARQLQVIVDQGKDPRQEKRKQTAEAVAQLERERLTQEPALEAWAHYIHARRHHWGEAHIACHEDAAKPGGEPHCLFDMLTLVDIDPARPQGFVKVAVNGQEAGYTQPLVNGDRVEIGWEG